MKTKIIYMMQTIELMLAKKKDISFLANAKRAAVIKPDKSVEYFVLEVDAET